MLTKLQFQTLFGFKPKRRKSTKKSASKSGKKVVKKSASKSGKKVVKKSNKVGTRMIKGVKRTVYKGKNGGKFYKKSNGRKVYFGPAMALAKTLGVKGAVKVMSAKAIEGAGYTLGYQAANVGVSMLKKAIKKKKKSVAMGRKKMVAGKKRTVYKTATGAKYYKSAKGNKVYFGAKLTKSKLNDNIVENQKAVKGLLDTVAAHKQAHVDNPLHPQAHTHTSVVAFGKKRKSRRNTRFGGNHGYADLMSMAGPSPAMFASSLPRGL
jgi:hypothetical protein